MTDSADAPPLAQSPHVAVNGGELGAVPERAFAIWSKYEEVAMHFNDLLMRWRLQAISGLAALVTLGGWAIGNVKNPDQRYWGMLLLGMTFLFVWIGLAVLDLTYYRKLLAGAVQELLEIEKTLPIQLSTRIELLAQKGGRRGPLWFYALGLAPLLLILGYSTWRILYPPPTDSPEVVTTATVSCTAEDE